MAGLAKYSFLCPIGSIFQQQELVCNWWYNVNCSNTESHYEVSNKREGRRHDPEDKIDLDSCLVLMAMDPLGQQGGSDVATGCERKLGIYNGPGLQNVPAPYEFRGPSAGSIGFVNICEEYCQKRTECEYYVFDCKLSLCTMKMGNTAGSLVNSRYITGKKNNRAAKECQKEITTRFPPREPQPTAGSSLSDHDCTDCMVFHCRTGTANIVSSDCSGGTRQQQGGLFPFKH